MIAIRSEREIEILRKANQIVAEVHVAMLEHLRPGTTTRELDRIAEELITKQGAIPAFKGYHGYPASTCISIDEVVVHGIPGDQVIKEGQIVSIDVGARYKGYCGDAAVSLACGTLEPERRRLMEVTDLALSRAIRAAKEGNHLCEIGRAVETACVPAGYGIVRDFVGHGIGTEMHAEPQVPNFDTGERGPRLRAGMVLAIEPMVNMGTYDVKVLDDGWTTVTADGKPSAHFEHSVVVRDYGGEILSGSATHTWGQRTD